MMMMKCAVYNKVRVCNNNVNVWRRREEEEEGRYFILPTIILLCSTRVKT